MQSGITVPLSFKVNSSRQDSDSIGGEPISIGISNEIKILMVEIIDLPRMALLENDHLKHQIFRLEYPISGSDIQTMFPTAESVGQGKGKFAIKCTFNAEDGDFIKEYIESSDFIG